MRQEDRASAAGFVIARFDGRFELLLLPRLKVLHRLRDHRKAHMRMLQPAELRALSSVSSRLLDLEPERGGVPRQKVAFAGNARCPETVDHIGGIRENNHGSVHRNVYLIGRGDGLIRLRIRVNDFPPPLMADDLDGDGVL